MSAAVDGRPALVEAAGASIAALDEGGRLELAAGGAVAGATVDAGAALATTGGAVLLTGGPLRETVKAVPLVGDELGGAAAARKDGDDGGACDGPNDVAWEAYWLDDGSDGPKPRPRLDPSWGDDATLWVD